MGFLNGTWFLLGSITLLNPNPGCSVSRRQNEGSRIKLWYDFLFPFLHTAGKLLLYTEITVLHPESFSIPLPLFSTVFSNSSQENWALN